jgi:tetratricopeptide (TPR) repeat protein
VAAKHEKLGPDHPNTLMSKRNLAAAYSTAGRFDESITLAKEIVTVDQATLGADHSQTRFDSAKLALRYRDAGRHEEAIPIYRAILDGFGTNIRASLPTMLELAVTYRRAGRLDEADRLVADAAAKCLEHGQYANAFRLARAGNAELMDSILKKLIAQNHAKAGDGLDLIVIGELRLVAGDFEAATVAIRAAIERNDKKYFMYKTLGWALLAQGQVEAAKEAFETVLTPLRNEDGTYNLGKADADRMTCAYFLDLVTEEEYVDHLKSRKTLVCYPWFYVGQRREIEGDREAAIAAYKRCIELGQDEQTANPVRWLAEWRLGMLANKPD